MRKTSIFAAALMAMAGQTAAGKAISRDTGFWDLRAPQSTVVRSKRYRASVRQHQRHAAKSRARRAAK